MQQKIAELKKRLKDKRANPGDKLAAAALGHKKRKKEDDSDNSDAEDPLFRGASSSTRAPRLAVIAQQDPGRLWESGILEMARHLGVREGATDTEVIKDIAGRAVSYLNAIFLGTHSPDQIGLRTTQEMRLLAESLDALAAGKLPQLGDLLMQRFKALEMSVVDKGWSLASQLDITKMPSGLTSEDEKMVAAKSALFMQKIADTRRRLSSPS